MDIFFHDPEDTPLPPDEVHIRQFRVKPYPDGRRISVYLEISPFQKRPSGEVTIFDSLGRDIATATIIETVDPRMEMTMHLRGRAPKGEYIVKVDLFYDDLPDPEDVDGDSDNQIKPKRQWVDHAEANFNIENRSSG